MKLKNIIALIIASFFFAPGCKKEALPVKSNTQPVFRGFHLSSLSFDVRDEALQKELDALVFEMQESIKYSKWDSEGWVSSNEMVKEYEEKLSMATDVDEREDLIETIRLLDDHKDEEEFQLIGDNRALVKKFHSVWDKIDSLNKMRQKTAQ